VERKVLKPIKKSPECIDSKRANKLKRYSVLNLQDRFEYSNQYGYRDPGLIIVE
jgi:hypothetical protein